MELFAFNYQGHQFAVHIDVERQLESLVVDGNEVSVKFSIAAVSFHEFDNETLGNVRLDFEAHPEIQQANYQLSINNVPVINALADLEGVTKEAVVEGEALVLPQAQQRAHKRTDFSWLALGGIAIKLLKTVKVIKVALAAATVAVYTVMFTFEFALALLAVLVFHEYGHLRAMKKFGIPTKGMYLIPFFGGIAVGDKPRTQWEDVYISMMGPVYGLAMTAVFYVAYLVTDSHFCGLVASTSALVNLFNLIPVYPLDGGRIVKALVFSHRNYLALVVLLAISALCLVVSWKLGLAFLAFFIILGVIDIVSTWNVPLAQDITPLKPYGIWFSVSWYLGVAIAFIAMILLIAKDGVPGSEIAVKILQS